MKNEIRGSQDEGIRDGKSKYQSFMTGIMDATNEGIMIGSALPHEFESIEISGYKRLDIKGQAHNDRPMTEINREQVADMIAANKSDVNARLADFDASIKTGFAELRTEFAKQSGDMRTEMANVRAEMHKNTIDVIKWVIVTVLGVATATVSILTFVINNAAPKNTNQSTAQPVAQQQAPLIVAVPAGSALLSPPSSSQPTPAPAAK